MADGEAVTDEPGFVRRDDDAAAPEVILKAAHVRQHVGLVVRFLVDDVAAPVEQPDVLGADSHDLFRRVLETARFVEDLPTAIGPRAACRETIVDGVVADDDDVGKVGHERAANRRVVLIRVHEAVGRGARGCASTGAVAAAAASYARGSTAGAASSAAIQTGEGCVERVIPVVACGQYESRQEEVSHGSAPLKPNVAP